MAVRAGRGPVLGRVVVSLSALTAVALLAARGESGVTREAMAAPTPVAAAPSRARAPSDALALLPPGDSLWGRSGKLRARLVGDRRGAFALPFLNRYFGNGTAGRPGVYAVSDPGLGRPLTFIRMLPFAEKRNGRIGQYVLGSWPGEGGRFFAGAYGNPEGFIEVTPSNQDTRLSDHFRLRDFLTHDQAATWPKYLVLREELVDKLELVIDELTREGHTVQRMSVMSGFRTPRYNASGGETSGRAGLSRHMYGDAADVFVDNDGDGRMDDLNGDGMVDFRDARVILAAVERVERAHPDLTGGVGVYRATPSHGPFAHVDVRGRRARWGLS